MIFENRSDAGRKLAEKISEKYSKEDIVLYAIPRGGVIVAHEICKQLHTSMDLIITRKIGHPDSKEYAIGAITESTNGYFNQNIIESIDKNYLKKEIANQIKEAKRRKSVYLAGKTQISCDGKTAILVDDGVATGMDMKAAIIEIEAKYRPKHILVAVPVIPETMVSELYSEFGAEVICLYSPADFGGSIGGYYSNFSQVSDKEVLDVIKKTGIK